LDQITRLQQERSLFRKDQEESRTSSLNEEEERRQSEAALREQLSLAQQRVENLERAVGEWESRSHAVEARHSEVEGQLEAQLHSIQRDRDSLQGHLQGLLGDMAQALESRMESGASGECVESRCLLLLESVRGLVEREGQLRSRVHELENKEAAYQTTLQHTDAIYSAHLEQSASRIRELEALWKARASQGVQGASDWPQEEQRARTPSSSQLQAKVQELLSKAVEFERTEYDLKAANWESEKRCKELQIKVAEQDKQLMLARSELREQDGLVSRMAELERENSQLCRQIMEGKEGLHRLAEAQQTEGHLKARLEELEASEASLLERLKEAQESHGFRERRLRDQVEDLQETVSSLRAALDGAGQDMEARAGQEAGLRRQLEALKARLQESEHDLRDHSSESQQWEVQHRSEVNKLRTQLRLVNGQLAELDEQFCAQQAALREAHAANAALGGQMEENKTKYEADLSRANTEAESTRSRLEEVEGELHSVYQLSAVRELDILAETAIGPALREALAALEGIQQCPHCGSRDELNNFRQTLATLTKILHGEEDGSDTDEGHSSSRDACSMDDTESQHSLVISINDPNSQEDPTMKGSDITYVQRVSCSQQDTLHHSMEDIEMDEGTLETGPSFDVLREASATSTPVPAGRKKRKTKKEDNKAVALIRSSLRNRKRGNLTILEELEVRLREVEDIASRRGEELRIADQEATLLSRRVAEREEETTALRQGLASLEERASASEGETEAARRGLLECRRALEETLKTQSLRCGLKDSIIHTLVAQMRAILRNSKMGVITTQIRQNEDRNRRNEEQRRLKGDSTTEDGDKVPDYDVEAVCSRLEEPLSQEVAYSSE